MLSKEPTLNIGIILPEDRRTDIEISFPNQNNYTIKSHNSNLSKPPPNLIVSLKDGEIEIIDNIGGEIVEGITIHNVPAGRGFHWGKNIDVSFPGNIKITSKNGHLIVVNCVPLEQYLSCVAVSEMSGACPPEFLEAQSITARSWILAAAEKKHAELGIDACNDDCCQRYQGLSQLSSVSKKTVENSRGVVITHNSEICDARYSKSCGGLTENCENVWNMEPRPYLKNVFDGPDKYTKVDWENWFTHCPNTFCSPQFLSENNLSKFLGNVDENKKYFRWVVRFTQNEFCSFFSIKINEKVSYIKNINILNRGESGRIINLNLEYQTEGGSAKSLQLDTEYDIRKTLHPSFLFSSAFICKLNKDHIQFVGGGWGHGVGLCQIGALAMALNGYSSKEILNHYFQYTTLKKLY